MVQNDTEGHKTSQKSHIHFTIVDHIQFTMVDHLGFLRDTRKLINIEDDIYAIKRSEYSKSHFSCLEKEERGAIQSILLDIRRTTSSSYFKQMQKNNCILPD